MRKLLIGLLLLSAPKVALADDQPLQGPYDEPDSHVVDGIATSMAVLPAMAAVSACAMLMLPADMYWKVRRPQDDFSTHVGDPVCPYPGVVVAYSIYLVGGFPFFVGEKLLGTLAAPSFAGGGSPSSPLGTEI